MNDPEKELAKVKFTLGVLYAVQAATAIMWVVATVLASLAFVTSKSSAHADIFVALVCVVLLIIQELGGNMLRRSRSSWQTRVRVKGDV